MEEMSTSSTPNTNSMMKFAPLLLVGLLVVGGVAAMAMKQPKTMDTPSTTSEQNRVMEGSTAEEPLTMPAEDAPAMNDVGSDPATTSEMAADSDVRVINVEGGSFYYKPNELRVKKGETVKIVFSSKDMMHDLVVDELGLKVPVTKGGATSEVTFTPEKAGTFEFYCSVGQHRAQGQVGTLIVE